MTRSTGTAVLAVLAALAGGCGGGSAPGGAQAAYATGDVSARSAGGDYGGAATGGLAMAPPPADAPMAESESVDSDDMEREVARRVEIAAAQPARPLEPGAGGQPAQTQTQTPSGSRPQTATDAVELTGPLLIYTADLYLSIFEVEQSQEAILTIVRELEGYLQRRDDNTVVVRVPARRFNEALQRIEQVGDVTHRNVVALDVSEEFRDLAIRIRNSEAMRDRLEALLRQANNVEQALQVERELERITELIETMKGRQRFLADRISFSTITVLFQPRPRETLDDPEAFRLPFPWLEQLGLRNLLNLGYGQ